MHKIALFGAGKIGEAISGLLSSSGQYKVKVCDISYDRAAKVAAMWNNCEPFELDLKNKKASLQLLKGCKAVISALPFFCNIEVAALAQQSKVHYFDLTEDVKISAAIKKLAEKRNTASCFMPQCGLAPGFISIAAMQLIKSFDQIDTVKMRVGALPIYPSNRLKYSLTWSTEGLINEYCNPCDIIDEGKRIKAQPLEGYEIISVDGTEYEAFNTSGGLGSLAETMHKRVRKLDYKSLRYPGHREYIAFLLHDLRFFDDRESLRNIFERSITATAQDKCIIFVDVSGTIKGRFLQKTYASTVYNTFLGDHHFGAIQVTTASGICTPLDLLLKKKIKAKKGFLRCEDIPLMDFLNNQFGHYYKDDKALRGIAV